MLKRTCKFAALALALSVWGSPLMACMVLDDTFTEAERECCQQMGDRCAAAMMPDSHSCCKTTVQQIDSYLANSRFSAPHSYPVTMQIAGKDFCPPATLAQAQPLAEAHSPPVSPPETISILRI